MDVFTELSKEKVFNCLSQRRVEAPVSECMGAKDRMKCEENPKTYLKARNTVIL
jgi:hypothetical protein